MLTTSDAPKRKPALGGFSGFLLRDLSLHSVTPDHLSFGRSGIRIIRATGIKYQIHLSKNP
jgi:hypothetical protein